MKTLNKLFAAAAVLLLWGTAYAQNDSLSRKNFGKESVASSRSTSTPEADTLDTGNPEVKIILFQNHTWRYIKDPDLVTRKKVFTEHWTPNVTNPYRISEESLPESFTLWIVDTLDSYCCPNKTRPFSKYGYRHGRQHTGVDLPYPTGTPVYAAFDGKVRCADYIGGYGNLVVLRHENGLETFYGHCSELKVKVGDWVHAGDVIALGGSTGRSSGPHLHFETRYRGLSFDPLWLIDFESGVLRHRLFRLKRSWFSPGCRYYQVDDDEDVIAEGDEKDRVVAEEKARQEAAAREAAAQAAMRYHTVRSGDTLYAIARKYGTSVSTLCRLNGIKETTILQVGRRLRVK